MSCSNKRSHEELLLLRGITSTLETNLRSAAQNNDNGSDVDDDNLALPAATLTSKTLAPVQPNQQPKSAVDISQSAVKNFLAEKTLIKSITKACVAENVAACDLSIINQLVNKYKNDYSGLTLQKVVESVTRSASSSSVESEASDEKESGNSQSSSAPNAERSEESAAHNAEKNDVASNEEGSEEKVGRCIALIDEEMKQYYVKIAEIKAKRRKKEAKIAAKAKRKREQAAAAAAAATTKEDSTTSETVADATDEAPKKKRKRTTKKKAQQKSSTKFSDPDDALYAEMTERYYRIKETNEHLPSRALETIIAETKRDMHRDDFDVPHRTVYFEIKKRWNKRKDVGATMEGEQVKRVKEMYDELYRQYCELKSSQKKLPTGGFAALSNKVKGEFGLPDDFAISKNRITYRYRREFPEHKSNPDHVIEIRKLSNEDKKRREHLLNEVVARYLKEKADNEDKKLPNGSIERIIEETKKDLDIHDFDVAASSIRGRIHRKSYYVSHENGNRDDIDDLLVETINSWLSNGISVSRDQGLQLANQMLGAKNLNKDSNGNIITLDAVWWKCFLNRNHHNLKMERNGLN